MAKIVSFFGRRKAFALVEVAVESFCGTHKAAGALLSLFTIVAGEK